MTSRILIQFTRSSPLKDSLYTRTETEIEIEYVKVQNRTAKQGQTWSTRNDVLMKFLLPVGRMTESGRTEDQSQRDQYDKVYKSPSPILLGILPLYSTYPLIALHIPLLSPSSDPHSPTLILTQSSLSSPSAVKSHEILV